MEGELVTERSIMGPGEGRCVKFYTGLEGRCVKFYALGSCAIRGTGAYIFSKRFRLRGFVLDQWVKCGMLVGHTTWRKT